MLLMLDNHIDYVLAWFAVSTLQAIQVPVNTAYHSELLQNVIDRAGARVGLVDSRYLDRLAALTTPLRHLESLLIRGDVDEYPPISESR